MTGVPDKFSKGTYKVADHNGAWVYFEANSYSGTSGYANVDTEFKVDEIKTRWGHTKEIICNGQKNNGWIDLTFCKLIKKEEEKKD